MIRQDQRDHLKSVLDWEMANHQWIGYQKQRPEADISIFESDLDRDFRRGIKQLFDCSTFVMMNCNFVGFKDPSGRGFNGFGNSADFYNHLSHFTNPLATLLGTIVVFGAGGADHAAFVYEGGITDPILCSHGSPAGPGQVPLSAFADIYPEHTFCSIGSL